MSGAGHPVVVLVNGSGGPLEAWSRVSPEIEKLGTIFAYNRLGIDGSDKPTAPQTGRAVAAALRELLDAAGLRPPYVLVGHSLGGLYANLFARLFAGEVQGVVLVEATHPSDVAALAELKSPLTRVVQRMVDIPAALFGKNTFAEIEFVAETIRQIPGAGPFPDVPVAIVTGGKSPPTWMMPAAARQTRLANQRDFLTLSSNTRQLIAEKSGHFPQITEPAVVVEAIGWTIARRLPS